MAADAGVEASSRPMLVLYKEGSLKTSVVSFFGGAVYTVGGGGHRLGSHPPPDLLLKQLTSSCLSFSGYKMGLIL